MDADFARLRAEDETFHTDKVADVHQLLEHHVIVFGPLYGFLGGGGDGLQVVAGDVHLYAPFRVLQFHKRCLSHHAAAHHASGDAHLAWLGVVAEAVAYLSRESVGGILCGGIGIDAHLSQCVERLSAQYFLFTQF